MKKIVFSAVLTAVVGWVAFTLVGNKPETSVTDRLANASEVDLSTTPDPVVELVETPSPTDWKTVVAGGEELLPVVLRELLLQPETRSPLFLDHRAFRLDVLVAEGYVASPLFQDLDSALEQALFRIIQRHS